MKKTALLLFIISLSLNLLSQEIISNLDEAKKEAKESHKRILIVFEGSDWCAPCMKLEKEILSTQTFKSLASKEFIILKADFPRSRKNKQSKEIQAQNKVLAEKYNTKGYFPYIAVLNSNAQLIGSKGYKKTSPKEYFNELNAIKQ